jgi:hypothetical protein
MLGTPAHNRGYTHSCCFTPQHRARHGYARGALPPPRCGGIQTHSHLLLVLELGVRYLKTLQLQLQHPQLRLKGGALAAASDTELLRACRALLHAVAHGSARGARHSCTTITRLGSTTPIRVAVDHIHHPCTYVAVRRLIRVVFKLCSIRIRVTNAGGRVTYLCHAGPAYAVSTEPPKPRMLQ